MTPSNRTRLVAALQARLDALFQQCDVYRAAWIVARDEAEQDRIADKWEATFSRSEMTRRALIRVCEGMPYWRWAAHCVRALAARGLVYTSSGAVEGAMHRAMPSVFPPSPEGAGLTDRH